MDLGTLKMQKHIIETSETRLKKELDSEVTKKISQYESYIGLEMIIDTVKTIDIEKLEIYLNEL